MHGNIFSFRFFHPAAEILKNKTKDINFPIRFTKESQRKKSDVSQRTDDGVFTLAFCQRKGVNRRIEMKRKT
ncbi:hypothetical protein GGER_30180 [Serratia rubidaea]